MPLPALAGKGIIGYGRLATHRVTPANDHQRGTGGEQQHDCARDASDSGTRLGDAGIAAVLATVGARRTWLRRLARLARLAGLRRRASLLHQSLFGLEQSAGRVVDLFLSRVIVGEHRLGGIKRLDDAAHESAV